MVMLVCHLFTGLGVADGKVALRFQAERASLRCKAVMITEASVVVYALEKEATT